MDRLLSTPTLAQRWIPVIPSEFQVYDSYAIDPKWQMKLVAIYASFLGFTTLISMPFIYRTIRNGRYYSGLAIVEYPDEPTPRQSPPTDHFHLRPSTRFAPVRRVGKTICAVWQSVTLYTLPLPNIKFWSHQVGDCCRRAYFSLGLAQTGLVLAYICTVVACFVTGAQLVENSNRAGFIALAQLPLIVLLSLKSPLPIPFFLPTLSYEHYNFMHRWVGRTLWLCVTIHGSLWLHQFITTGQWDQVWSDKAKRGMIAYGLMCGVVITSLKPVRRLCYTLFWMAHVCLFVGFFAAIGYHTPYSIPWIWPCVVIYGYDLVVRLLRFRIKEATIIPIDKTMVMIHIPDCDAGWLPTQHLHVRVLRGLGIFEAHPFTITNAPSTSSISTSARGIILYAKVSGDWTRRLHALASDLKTIETGDDISEREGFLASEKRAKEQGEDSVGVGVGGKQEGWFNHPGRKVAVMLDGPYGGLKMDLGDYDGVFMVAGGSGVTFVLGAIEEALRAREKGGGPSKVDVAWVVKDFSTIEALAPTFTHLHNLAANLSLEVNYNLYLSYPPSSLPSIPTSYPPGTTLNPYRPEVAQLVHQVLPPSHGSVEAGNIKSTKGGLAVIACGPEGIVMEARNAVAGMGVMERVKCGGVAFHGECYAL